jgi:hypothetical protein
MARPLKSVVASALIAFGLSLLLPALAPAADAPWVGTYRGVGVGQDTEGDKARSGVTVWVQDAGGSTTFTFRFDKVPYVFSRTVPNEGGVKGSMLMRIAVDEPGIRGAAMIVVYPKNGNYMMAGKGVGTALRKQGKGRMGAVRTSTGVQLPSIADQVKDLFTAVLTRKTKTSSSAGDKSGGSSMLDLALPPLFSDDSLVRVASAGVFAAEDGAEGTEDDPDAIVRQAPDVVFVKAVVVEPATIVDLAEARPPVTTQAAFTVALLLIVLTGIAAVVGVGPRVRRAAAATAATAAGRPDTTDEGS